MTEHMSPRGVPRIEPRPYETNIVIRRGHGFSRPRGPRVDPAGRAGPTLTHNRMLGSLAQCALVRSRGFLKSFGLTRSLALYKSPIGLTGRTLAAHAHAVGGPSSLTHIVRLMSNTAASTSTMTTMDPVPDSMKSTMLVSSYKEELRRRQRVHTTYFDFPVKDFSGEDR
jgi:hypothetical protein